MRQWSNPKTLVPLAVGVLLLIGILIDAVYLPFNPFGMQFIAYKPKVHSVQIKPTQNPLCQYKMVQVNEV